MREESIISNYQLVKTNYVSKFSYGPLRVVVVGRGATEEVMAENAMEETFQTTKSKNPSFFSALLSKMTQLIVSVVTFVTWLLVN